MKKMITVVLVGAGNRADVYASVSLQSPEKMKVVGIVDPDPIRRELMRERYNVPVENCFEDVSEFVKREKFADAVINGTMDHLHVPTSIPVLEKGYDLLLEKPFAVNEAEMERLVEVARKYKNKVVIGHVLRYTDFYRAIKQHVLNGDLGKIISIETCEHVSYHHMAASYVRGKWSSEKICFAPMLLAKSCHDVDILLWMMKETQPTQVVSFGSDFQFGPERKPQGAGTRCMQDCPFVDECIYSAKSNYLAQPRWGQYVWKCLEKNRNLTQEEKAESLRTNNRYGKCVWDFNRDGNVDHQAVMFNFANGATGTFSMIGGCAKPERNIHIVGTLGEIKGTFDDSRYILRKMEPNGSYIGCLETVYDLNVSGDMIGAAGGHGGGDQKLVYDFLDYLSGYEPSVSCATLEDSVISHRAVFKAMESKYNNTIIKI
ncbi:MAG: Gfo/Idh/MocA family oxidoreductase [Clostridia bacterium]|nr:Gfo/Idh/MocA family oxidoreductase [Clostridia bacterium]MBR2646109.1 Gfo/Idh/MocA family oxidoreductase [Clostridia bacterium]